MKEIKPRWFYLGHINCDCAGYDHAWRRPFHSGEWPRCIHCNKRLGDMEVRFFGKFKAKTDTEAWAQYEAGRLKPKPPTEGE